MDVYAQDLSFVAIEKEGKLLGYDILAGGGMGYAYGNPGSFPALRILSDSVSRNRWRK